MYTCARPNSVWRMWLRGCEGLTVSERFVCARECVDLCGCVDCCWGIKFLARLYLDSKTFIGRNFRSF